MTTCIREPNLRCKCGAKANEKCPLAENTPDWAAATPIGAVPGTCDPDDGVCESCQ